MKRLTKSQLAKVSKNLDYYFNLASSEDIQNGLNWYKEANQFCIEQSKLFNLSPFVVASVVSALSPRNKWSTNLKDAITVLSAVKNNISPENTKVSTFHRNKFKAFALVKGLKEISNESRKTYAFVCNVGNLDYTRVTVDVWHLRACFNRNCGSIGKLAYDQLERLTISKAKKLGLKGFEYQAIIWNAVKNNF
jgi:hypothetical protein